MLATTRPSCSLFSDVLLRRMYGCNDRQRCSDIVQKNLSKKFSRWWDIATCEPLDACRRNAKLKKISFLSDYTILWSGSGPSACRQPRHRPILSRADLHFMLIRNHNPPTLQTDVMPVVQAQHARAKNITPNVGCMVVWTTSKGRQKVWINELLRTSK